MRKITKIEPSVSQIAKRKRVAAYARVSSGKDAMLQSLSAQVSYYSGYIQKRRDWEYAGVYADEALTGTKSERPEFQRLLNDCRNGKIDMVITKSIARFARNTVTMLETVRELKLLGIDVFFEKENIHSLSGDGEVMLTILASYAQEESRSASENQKWRVRKNYKEGKPVNHIRVYGYDYDNGKFTVIPEEAEIVRMIYADYLGGMGQNAIMKKLTRLGVPTKNSGKWVESCVAGILGNEKYIGDTLLQKKFTADHLTKLRKRNKGELPQYYVEGTHEPIISKDIFDAVQAESARRAAQFKQPGTRTFSEFTGIIRCQRCGANFRRKIAAVGTKYAKPTWACATFTYRGKDFCGAKRIPEGILKQKCAEVLGIAEYDAAVFKAKVKEINVPDDGVLVFAFRDGREVTATWENLSRRESWTEEMKAVASMKRRGRSN